ncbi:MAG: UDP-galactopyranose mutase, partial [Holosporaceae bacterium]|nr:UDP-galactopyranose mutase [Holosporaceae bacterium]
MIATDNLVIGAGISGAVIARLVAESGEKVLIVDKKDHIAGNCYDYIDGNGICIHKYGSHIFHTNNEKIWNFLQRFTDFNTYMHKVVALIDGTETTIPFNINTLHDVLPQSLARRLEKKLLVIFSYGKKIAISDFLQQEDNDLKFLAIYVYEKIFQEYSQKQWGQIPDSAVTARVPIYISRDNRYFQDKYQGIPQNGYTKMIEKMLDHPNIELVLNRPFKGIDHKDEMAFSSMIRNNVKIFHTGSIDEFFDYRFGQLPYRSVNFKFETHNKEFYQSNSVVNYPCNYDFTRIHEYKYYLGDKSTRTIIAKEYAEEFEPGKNERYYPIANV